MLLHPVLLLELAISVGLAGAKVILHNVEVHLLVEDILEISRVITEEGLQNTWRRPDLLDAPSVVGEELCGTLQ